MSATDKTPSVKDEIAVLSKAIADDLTVDAKASTMAAAEDIYSKNLPEGLSMTVVDQVRDYNTAFVAAGAHAVGKIAVEAMTTHKKLDQLSVEIGMGGKDAVHYSVDRKKVTIDQIHNKGAEIVKYGVVTTGLTVGAGKNAGQLKVARAEIGALALAALAK